MKNTELSKNVTIEKKDFVKSAITEKKREFAVFLYRNQQFKVSVGDSIYLPLITKVKEKEKIIFDQVILTKNQVGTPFISGTIVEGEIINPLQKGKKVIVFKYKAKKNYRVKTGYRSKLTLIKIKQIKNKTTKKETEKNLNNAKLKNK